MKTVDLEIVIFDDKNLNLYMKVSYLNMMIYYKYEYKNE